MFEDGIPIFTQLADQIASDILTGSYAEGDQVPSINELAAFYRINPATANRAVSGLVDRGVLEKRRGIGMFVAAGARAKIAGERSAALVSQYVQPLVQEARRLGITTEALIKLIEKETNS